MLSSFFHLFFIKSGSQSINIEWMLTMFQAFIRHCRLDIISAIQELPSRQIISYYFILLPGDMQSKKIRWNWPVVTFRNIGGTGKNWTGQRTVFKDYFKCLIQCCPLELSVMKETFYIFMVQYGSQLPHVVIEQLKCN